MININLNLQYVRYGVLLILFLTGLLQASAQCTCDHTVSLSVEIFDGDTEGVSPGDVICVEDGIRDRLHFVNIDGTAANPVTIINCGGQVVINGTGKGTSNVPLKLNGNSHFRVTGTGDAAFTYGFKINGEAHASVDAGGQATNFELDHIEVGSSGFAGFMIKTDPNGSGENVRPNAPDAVNGGFTMYDVSIHDCHIHDILPDGEGIYMGNSFWASGIPSTGQYPHSIYGAKIYNNLIERTGREAIQAGAVVEGLEIYNNEIYDYGYQNTNGTQNNGFQIGEGSSGKIYNNFLKNGPDGGSRAIYLLGLGDLYVYNNVVVGAGNVALNANLKFSPLADDPGNQGFLGGAYFINNTVIDTKGAKAFGTYLNDALDNVLYNNLIVSENPDWEEIIGGDWTKADNLWFASVAEADFVAPGNDDYGLKSTSDAVDRGTDVSSYGINIDFQENTRPVNGLYDIGAYEHQSASGGGGTGSAIYRVNAGGAFEEGGAVDWELDKQNDPVSYFDSQNCVNYTTGSVNWNGTNNTNAPNNVFGNYRYDNNASWGDRQHWDFPVSNGDYEVRLYFNSPNAARVNVFDVEIEGTLELDDYDIYAAAGGSDIPVEESFIVTVSDGNLNIYFPSISAGKSIINGIEILTVSNNPPVLGSIGDQEVMEGETLNVNVSATDPDGNDLILTASNLPSFATFTDHGDDTGTLTIAPGNGDEGTYTGVGITADDGNGGEGTEFFTITVNDNASGTGSAIYRVNAGGAFEEGGAVDWELDKQNDPVSYFDSQNSVNYTTGSVNWNGTNNTNAPNNVFGNYRYDNNASWGDRQHWDFPVSNGDYEVRLYFNSPNAAGVNVFDVEIEGTLELDDYDIYVAAGGSDIPVEESFIVIVSDGNLDIDFPSISAGKSIINGIEILTVSSSGSRIGGDMEELIEDNESTWTVYPNPVEGAELTIDLSAIKSSAVGIRLLDASGKLIATRHIKNEDPGRVQLNVSTLNLSPGIYFLRLEHGDGVEVRKVIFR